MNVILPSFHLKLFNCLNDKMRFARSLADSSSSLDSSGCSSWLLDLLFLLSSPLGLFVSFPSSCLVVSWLSSGLFVSCPSTGLDVSWASSCLFVSCPSTGLIVSCPSSCLFVSSPSSG